MDVQSSKHPCNKEDAADEPLFTYVDPQVFSTRPTFKTFKALLDNYSAYTGEEEEVSAHELRENQAFLDCVMQTAVMRYCHQYCLAKEASYKGDPVPESPSGFKDVLHSIWFELYSRSGGGRRRKMDSSGFEHGKQCKLQTVVCLILCTELKLSHIVSPIVFVGEVKNGQISGFHNWIQFYLEEKAGNVDYRGYIKPRSRDSNAATNDDDSVLTLQFSWNGVEKFVGTSFIGTNIHLYLSLYTVMLVSFLTVLY